MHGKGKHPAHSASQAKPDAKPPAKAKEEETEEEEEEPVLPKEMSVQAGRKHCAKDGHWIVYVNSRPKFKNGGWEVTIKSQGRQVWSKASCATTKVGDGMA